MIFFIWAPVLALLLLLAPLAPAQEIRCPIAIDGRIPLNDTLSTFNTAAAPFDPNNTKAANQSWSEILLLPSHLPASRFDRGGGGPAGSPHEVSHKPVEVTINSSSVFLPGGGQLETGFRRAGLLFGNGTDETNVGVTTFHWSVRQDPVRRMNLSHEYMNVWHEANSYQYNQFSINTGVVLPQDNPKTSNRSSTGLNRNLWKLMDRNNDVLWTTLIDWNTWQNFAVTMDMNNNTLQVYYSQGIQPLRAVTGRVYNNNTGGGQFQVGMLKKPTETTNVVYDGYQEPGIYEGQIYGGVFIEDSRGGCISL